MSQIFPSYTLGQLNIFNSFYYIFIDNSRKNDWKKFDFSKTMSGKIDPFILFEEFHSFQSYFLELSMKMCSKKLNIFH